MEFVCTGIARFDMSYDDFSDLCRKSWKAEDFNYILFDRSKRKMKLKIVFLTKTKEHIWSVY